MTRSDGKKLEKKTFEELKKVYAETEVEVYPSKHLKANYGGNRQVDAHIKGHPEFDFIIFECKDEGKIGLKASEQAAETMKDVGAKKAAIVGNGRYTKPLIDRCKYYGIDLLHIVDTKEKWLRTSVEFEVITSFTWINKYKYMGLFCGNLFDMKIPPEEIRSEYSKEPVHKMLCSLWNEGVLDKSSGTHQYTRDKFEMLASPERGLLRQVVDGLQFEYEVTKKFFLHQTPIAEGSGVLNVLKSQFTLTSPILSIGPMKINEFATNDNEISFEEVEEKTKQVAFVGDATFVMT